MALQCAALVLAACAGAGPTLPDRAAASVTAPAPNATPAGSGAAPQPAAPLPPAGTPLAMEQRFLEGWFRGTPVVIATQPPTTLQLDVPLMYSFAAGKTDVHPALGKVIDKVAESLLRHPGARVTITASGDAGGGAALAQARTQRLRDSLGVKGVSATRVALIEAARGGGPVHAATGDAAGSQPIAQQRSAGDRNPADARSRVQPISTQRQAAPTWTEKKQP